MLSHDSNQVRETTERLKIQESLQKNLQAELIAHELDLFTQNFDSSRAQLRRFIIPGIEPGRYTTISTGGYRDGSFGAFEVHTNHTDYDRCEIPPYCGPLIHNTLNSLGFSTRVGFVLLETSIFLGKSDDSDNLGLYTTKLLQRDDFESKIRGRKSFRFVPANKTGLSSFYLSIGEKDYSDVEAKLLTIPEMLLSVWREFVEKNHLAQIEKSNQEKQIALAKLEQEREKKDKQLIARLEKENLRIQAVLNGSREKSEKTV